MDANSDRSIVLLSIHPKYVEEMLKGRKTVEFRRTGIPCSVEHVVIYCTAPVKQVVGFFTVKSITKQPPASLWKQFRSVGGIGWKEFDEYYSGCKLGTVIEIKKLYKLSTPLPLYELGKNISPPQGIRYLSPTILKKFNSKKKKLLAA